MRKVFLPVLVIAAVQGVGLYLAQLAFNGNHQAHAIAAGVVAIATGIAFGWTASKVGLFRPKVVTSITVVARDPSTPSTESHP